MSLMKKYIISLLFVIVISLSSCKKELKMYVYEEDYNLLNEMLEVPIYCNIQDAPYMNINNIISVYIYDNDNKLPLEVDKINYVGMKNNKHEYNFIFDTLVFKDDLIVLKAPILEITYINNVVFSYKLKSVCIYNSQFSSDLGLVKMKGIYEDYLKGVILELKNYTCELIKISDLCLINAHFGADLSNLKVIDDYNNPNLDLTNMGDIYRNPSKMNEVINVYPNETIVLFIPIVYLNRINGNQSAFIIEYQVSENVKYKGIHNFVFLSNKEFVLGTYDA